MKDPTVIFYSGFFYAKQIKIYVGKLKKLNTGLAPKRWRILQGSSFGFFCWDRRVGWAPNLFPHQPSFPTRDSLQLLLYLSIMNQPYRLPYKDDNDDRLYTVSPEEEEDLEDKADEGEIPKRGSVTNDFGSRLRVSRIGALPLDRS